MAHAAFLAHPGYFEPVSRQFINACTAAEVLAAQRETAQRPQPGLGDRLTRALPRAWVRWATHRYQDWADRRRPG